MLSYKKFWNIRKYTNGPIAWFFCSPIFFVKWSNFGFFKSIHVSTFIYATLEAIKLENKQGNSITNFVETFINWTAFLISKFVISFAVFSFVRVWKENEEQVTFMCFVIAMTLGWFSYLQMVFSIGLWEMFVVLRKSWSAFIP